ncbi:MAG: 50S ribosomal protein L13 [Candidatus Woesearchaeota archaeon]
MIVIDAKNLVLGRFATYAAKQALLGQDVRIINAEKAIISGTRKKILADFKRDREMGIPTKGPFMPKLPDRYVRRVIRGMLPHHQTKGTEAFKRVLCFKGVPEEFKDAKIFELPDCSVEKFKTLKYITLEEALKYN